MCKFLGIPRSLVYYKRKERKINSALENEVIKIFKKSRNNYGCRKIKVELKKLNIIASRQKIGSIMKKYNLVSNYTIKQFKVHKSTCNQAEIGNVVDRKFDGRQDLEVIISDLTYVKVAGKWCYICLLVNLFNREIVGFSVGKNKTANLVYEAFLNSNINLLKVNIFHTDRGKEFDNALIDEVLKAFNIERSLSKKGCPYDNAVAEATYKIIKTEFISHKTFNSLRELNLQLADYLNWYNNYRIHGSLGYLSPKEFKNNFVRI